MAVGIITEAEQVNQIFLAGRADLVCLARPHLADPSWTLHQALASGDDEAWPLPYLAGHDQARRLMQKAGEAIRA
jgi:anthraniloyl-CoA monooxygenase